jgi:hypothetical protein
LAEKGLLAFIRRATCLEVDFNVKREMRKSFRLIPRDVARFLSKLASKNQSAERQAQAARSVGLYYDLVARQPREPELRGGHRAGTAAWASRSTEGAWAIQPAGARDEGETPEEDAARPGGYQTCSQALIE